MENAGKLVRTLLVSKSMCRTLPLNIHAGAFQDYTNLWSDTYFEF